MKAQVLNASPISPSPVPGIVWIKLCARLDIPRIRAHRAAIRWKAADVELRLVKQRERWRPVVGYERHYEVSNLGRVRRHVNAPRGRGSRRGRILKHVPNGHGYPNVSLCKEGKQYSCGVHQIVCRAFRGPPPFKGAEVTHRDGDKTNPRLKNLRWASHAENGKDMVRHRVARSYKLKPEQVLEIRRRWKPGMRRPLAEEFGVSATTISAIVNRRTFKYL